MEVVLCRVCEREIERLRGKRERDRQREREREKETSGCL